MLTVSSYRYNYINVICLYHSTNKVVCRCDCRNVMSWYVHSLQKSFVNLNGRSQNVQVDTNVSAEPAPCLILVLHVLVV